MSHRVSTIQPDEKPYFIVISGSAPATRPHRHETFDSAYDESVRLSKLYHGFKFGVFKYAGHAVTTKSPTTKTE